MARKPDKKTDAKVHDDLNGFSLQVNAFGQIESSFPIDQLNAFLNENVEDKKLKGSVEDGEETAEDSAE